MAVDVPLLKVPDHVLAACQQGGRHLIPVMQAVRYYAVSLVFVPQGIKDHHEVLPAVLGEPFIALIGDDMHQALGPKAFGKKMLARLIREADVAAIIACEALHEVYDQMSQQAAIGRRNVLIIETLPDRELEWLSCLRRTVPKLPITLCTVKPEVGASSVHLQRLTPQNPSLSRHKCVMQSCVRQSAAARDGGGEGKSVGV